MSTINNNIIQKQIQNEKIIINENNSQDKRYSIIDPLLSEDEVLFKMK